MKLDGDQIAVIRKKIDQSGIEIQTLKDDLIDHLCCVTESKIERGKSFEITLAKRFMN